MANTDLRAFQPTEQAWKDLNEALKLLRDKIGEEGPVGVPTTESIDITDTHLGGGLNVPVLLKDASAKGSDQNMCYSFSETNFHPLDWRSILKMFPQDTFEEMIGQQHVVQLKVEPVIGVFSY